MKKKKSLTQHAQLPAARYRRDADVSTKLLFVKVATLALN
jgi:hypothetical protein